MTVQKSAASMAFDNLSRNTLSVWTRDNEKLTEQIFGDCEDIWA